MRSLKIILLSLSFALSLKAETLEGIAKSKNGDFVYRELHTLVRDESNELESITTNYFKKDGSEFASMNSNFKKNKYVPDTIFIDRRFDEKITTSLINGEIEFNFFKKDVLTKTKKLKLDDQMVAGQGFDNFLRDKIIKPNEKSKSVHFVVIPQADYFRFKISDLSGSDQSERQITIKPESFVIRMLVDEIKLTYTNAGRTLKRFQGISNLNNDKNQSQIVDIELKKIKD